MNFHHRKIFNLRSVFYQIQPIYSYKLCPYKKVYNILGSYSDFSGRKLIRSTSIELLYELFVIYLVPWLSMYKCMIWHAQEKDNRCYIVSLLWFTFMIYHLWFTDFFTLTLQKLIMQLSLSIELVIAPHLLLLPIWTVLKEFYQDQLKCWVHGLKKTLPLKIPQSIMLSELSAIWQKSGMMLSLLIFPPSFFKIS